jgi:hypothetical protein
MADPAGVKNDGQINAGFIHAGQQFLRRDYPGFRLRIKQGKARVGFDIFVTPFPQPGGKYMGMKIYNHLRHYTQTTKNTKYHSLLSLRAPERCVAILHNYLEIASSLRSSQ